MRVWLSELWSAVGKILMEAIAQKVQRVIIVEQNVLPRCHRRGGSASFPVEDPRSNRFVRDEFLHGEFPSLSKKT